MQCFAIHWAVLLTKHTERAQTLLMYSAIIARLSKKFRLPTCIINDQYFHQEARDTGKADWSRIDSSIHAQCFTGMSLSAKGWCSICTSMFAHLVYVFWFRIILVVSQGWCNCLKEITQTTNHSGFDEKALSYLQRGQLCAIPSTWYQRSIHTWQPIFCSTYLAVAAKKENLKMVTCIFLIVVFEKRQKTNC